MANAPTYGARWPVYAKQWDSLKVNPNKVSSFTAIAKKILANKARYQAAEKLTGVPWYMIAVIHVRESSLNWNTQLGQGDPLNRKSTHVPRGRGPFKTWEDGTYDALVNLKHLDKVTDWRLEKIAYYLEPYNGWGYYYHGVPSAYLWAGTNVYHGGKYVSDGVWSSTAVDTQPGTMALLKILTQLDPSIKLKRESNIPDPKISAPVVVGAGGVGLLAWAGQHEWALAFGVALLIAGAFYLYYMYRKID